MQSESLASYLQLRLEIKLSLNANSRDMQLIQRKTYLFPRECYISAFHSYSSVFTTLTFVDDNGSRASTYNFMLRLIFKHNDWLIGYSNFSTNQNAEKSEQRKFTLKNQAQVTHAAVIGKHSGSSGHSGRYRSIFYF